MKVGDYVRTNEGHIGKITFIYDLHKSYDDNNDYSNEPNIELDNWNKCFAKDDIKTSSSNIIDLIEEGDYVNSEKVIKTFSNDFGKGIIYGYIANDKQLAIAIYEDKIKLIATKEQFEEIEYEVK